MVTAIIVENSLDGQTASSAELELAVCSECGAVAHGNLCCNTCRQCMNAALGCSLPPYPYPAARPCGAEEVQRFMSRLHAASGE